MNFLDTFVISHLNHFARKSWTFDQAVAFLSVNYLLKGGVLMVLVWWAWFRTESRTSKDRDHIIATMLSCVVALAVGRMMVILLPFRLRPLHEMSLNLVTPYGVAEDSLAKLSSFPSDHAVLFFALVTGVFFISRALGVFALLYTIVVVALPRMYLGLHYPTDILAGAFVGVAISWLGNTYLPRTASVQSIKDFSWFKPMYFYPALFLVTYQIADLFENSRALVGGVFKLGKSLLGNAGMG
jgi:undecaprenyl-diphosphatase